MNGQQRTWIYRQWVLFFVIIFVSGCSQMRVTVPATKDPFGTNGQHATLHETVNIGNSWQIQMSAIKRSEGVNDEKPSGGNSYIICTLRFTNVSNHSQDIYSVTALTLQDTMKQRYAPIATTFAKSPDGTVAQGATVAGDIPFEVPASQSQFTLAFSTHEGQGYWDVTIATT